MYASAQQFPNEEPTITPKFNHSDVPYKIKRPLYNDEEQILFTVVDTVVDSVWLVASIWSVNFVYVQSVGGYTYTMYRDEIIAFNELSGNTQTRMVQLPNCRGMYIKKVDVRFSKMSVVPHELHILTSRLQTQEPPEERTRTLKTETLVRKSQTTFNREDYQTLHTELPEGYVSEVWIVSPRNLPVENVRIAEYSMHISKRTAKVLYGNEPETYIYCIPLGRTQVSCSNEPIEVDVKLGRYDRCSISVCVVERNVPTKNNQTPDRMDDGDNISINNGFPDTSLSFNVCQFNDDLEDSFPQPVNVEWLS